MNWDRSGQQKYHNVKTVVEGKTFDSKKEANRYQEILMMIKAGVVTKVILQPRFLIHESFTTRAGVKEKPTHYIADFAIKYKDKDIWVVEDVKAGTKPREGTWTDTFELKRKMFLKRYPCVEYLLV